MIVLGYHGVGEASCCNDEFGLIYLDDSVMDDSSDDWVERYCKLAADLSFQGYNVIISCRKSVREYISKHIIENEGNIFKDTVIVSIFPHENLKEDWIAMLKDIADKTKLAKDISAVSRAEMFYDEEINDLRHCGIPFHVLTSTKTSLSILMKKIEDLYD